MENRITQADIERVQQMGEKLKQYRKETSAVATSLSAVASQFRTTFKGLMTATIAGSAVTLLGGTLTTAGFILSFEKLDASLLLTSVGAGICGFGSLVTGGSALVEFMQQKKAKRTADGQINIYDQTRRKISNILKEFAEKFERLQLERIESHPPPHRSSFYSMLGWLKVGLSVVCIVIGIVVRQKFCVWFVIYNAVTSLQERKEITIASCATGCPIIAASIQATTEPGTGFRIAGGVLGIAMMPLNIGFLQYYCNALSTDEWPDTSRQIRETADKLLKKCPDENEITRMIDETVRIMNNEM